MALVFVGADFFDAPQNLLDRAEKSSTMVREALSDPRLGLDGVVVLATCNRCEVYAEAPDVAVAFRHIIAVLAEVFDSTPEHIGQIFRVLSGSAVTRHLFAVTAGLESMVVGEAEIAGQVRSAFAASTQKGRTTKRLNLLFQRAQRVSKKIWSTTDIGRSGRSIARTALQLAQEYLGGEAPQNVVVIGTGAYARVVVSALKKLGVPEISVFSRSRRAEHFAMVHGIHAIPANGLNSAIARAEVIVSASGQHGFVLMPADVSKALEGRTPPAPLVIIDVALSLDVDPRVQNVEGCTLISLETLRENTPREHSDTLRHVENLVDRETKEFDAEERAREIDPVVSALRLHINRSISKEIEAFERQSGSVNLDEASRRIANAILHTPSIRAKELARLGQQSEYLRAVELLFGLEVVLHDAP